MLAHPGRLVSIVPVVPMMQMRKEPGVSKIRPGMTSTPRSGSRRTNDWSAGTGDLGKREDVAAYPVER